MMITMIEDHNQRLNHKIKEHHEGWGVKDHGGSRAKTSKKGGSGGGPKNRQILHTGGEIWGGYFWGGPGTRAHKT